MIYWFRPTIDGPVSDGKDGLVVVDEESEIVMARRRSKVLK